MGRGRDTSITVGMGLALWLALFATQLHAEAVVHIALKPGGQWVFSILVAPGSTCSFRFPLSVKHMLLGNTPKFMATLLDEKIVAIKPKSDEENIFTTLQLVPEDSR